MYVIHSTGVVSQTSNFVQLPALLQLAAATRKARNQLLVFVSVMWLIYDIICRRAWCGSYLMVI